MSLNLIIGKPGSGKSYFAVSKIAENLCDFARYEKAHCESAEGGFWTNLRLNLEECNKYVKSNTGIDFDSEKYLHCLEDSFFYADDGTTPREWWLDIPIKQTVVVDEVHQYIPAHGTGSKEFMERLTKYMSQHRHYQHEIWMITQHTDAIHKNVLCMAEGAYHITNVKTRVIPFLGIPFADIDVVKEAWGIKQQIANITYGNYVGRSFKKESLTSMILKPEIYRLYVSHMHIKDAQGDSASLHLSRFGSIVWFLRRHFLQLGFKAGVVVGVAFAIRYMLTQAPEILSETLAGGMVEEQRSTPDVTCGTGDVSRIANVEKTDSQPLTVVTSGISVYGKNFIVTSAGRRVEIGGTFDYFGEKSKLLSVDFVRRSVDCERVSTADFTESRPDAIEVRNNGGTGTKVLRK